MDKLNIMNTTAVNLHTNTRQRILSIGLMLQGRPPIFKNGDNSPFDPLICFCLHVIYVIIRGWKLVTISFSIDNLWFSYRTRNTDFHQRCWCYESIWATHSGPAKTSYFFFVPHIQHKCDSRSLRPRIMCAILQSTQFCICSLYYISVRFMANPSSLLWLIEKIGSEALFLVLLFLAELLALQLT